MPRILAIDWDRLEARALSLQAGPTGTSITRAWIVPLSQVDRATPTGSQLGRQLAAALAGEPLGKATTLVGVGRDQVQMKLLSLPPAPPEELPELVRFQAEREFTALGDDAALDFIPLAGDASTPHQVLAAALAGSTLGEVNNICQALGAELGRVTLRACGAASFVARNSAIGANEILLVANCFEDEADLTVLARDKVVFVRSVRLTDPNDEAARGKALAGEIRRTMAAVRQQLGDQQVGRVVLCGTAGDSAEAATLAAELVLPVTVFDVAVHAPPGLARAGVPMEQVGRLAAVLGMALAEADRQPPVIDFLHVRRRVEQRRFSRLQALAAAAAAILVLSFGVHMWGQVAAARDELVSVTAQTASFEKQAKQYAKVTAQAGAIERWQATDVNWLDELDRFSEKWRPQTLDAKDFATAADALVTQLTAIRPPGNDAKGGRLDVQAVAKDAAAVATLEERLRDAGHRVATAGGKQEHAVPGYRWSFGLRMDVCANERRGRQPAMSEREKILAAAVLGLFLLWGGGKLWGRYNESLATQRSALFAAQNRLDEAKLNLERGRRAVKQLEAWQEQSLPADRDVAQSLYREWLRAKCSDVGVTLDDMQTNPRITRTDAYTTIGYSITAHGSLKAVTSLLYSFYRSTLLQQITQLQVRPGADSGQLTVLLQIEALVLPGSANKDKLPTVVSSRLARASADDYVKSITGRNLLTAYSPPRSEPPPGATHVEPPKPKFDDAEFAFVTAILEAEGHWHAWITVRTTGEVLRVAEGDAVKVGQFEGKVVSIAQRMVVLQSDKEELHIPLGHSLREAAKPATEANKS